MDPTNRPGSRLVSCEKKHQLSMVVESRNATALRFWQTQERCEETKTWFIVIVFL